MKEGGRRFVARKLLASGERFRLYRDELSWPGKKRVFREWAKRPLISAVIALVSPRDMALVRQHRYGINRWLWEIPAGTVHEGESPALCARRECEEETGWRPGRIRPLGSFAPTPAFADEQVHLFVATALKKTRSNPDFDERITVKIFSVAEVRRMLKRRVIQDAKSIIALYRFFAEDKVSA